jgi:hypothetical protein
MFWCPGLSNRSQFRHWWPDTPLVRSSPRGACTRLLLGKRKEKLAENSFLFFEYVWDMSGFPVAMPQAAGICPVLPNYTAASCFQHNTRLANPRNYVVTTPPLLTFYCTCSAIVYVGRPLDTLVCLSVAAGWRGSAQGVTTTVSRIHLAANRSDMPPTVNLVFLLRRQPTDVTRLHSPRLPVFFLTFHVTVSLCLARCRHRGISKTRKNWHICRIVSLIQIPLLLHH